MAKQLDDVTDTQFENLDEAMRRKLELAENDQDEAIDPGVEGQQPPAGETQGTAAGGEPATAAGGEAPAGADTGAIGGKSSGAAATGGYSIGQIALALGGLAALGGAAGGSSGSGGGSGGGGGFGEVIDGGEPPNATPKANNGSAVVLEDGSIGGQLDAVDDGALSYAFVKEVPGLTVDSDTGIYNFNAAQSEYQDLAAGETRVIEVGFIATDAQGKTGQAELEITITGTNDAPIATADVVGAHEDGAVVFGSVASNDSDVDASDTLTYTLSGPALAGLTFNSDGSYTFDAGHPDYQVLQNGDRQEFLVGYDVTDGTLSDSSALTITVTGTNDAPIANAFSSAKTEDGSILSSTLSATDADAGDSLTYALTSSAPGLTLTDPTTGAFTFDPSHEDYQDLKDGETLDVVAGYQVTDSQGATASSTIKITLTGVNDAPTVVDDADAVAENSVLTGSVATNDSDAEGDALTYALTAISYTDAGGTLYTVAGDVGFVLNSDGTYTLDATGAAFQDLAVGTSSAVTVDYSVDDATAAPVTGQLIINVSGTNDGPIASAVSASALEGAATAVTGNLSATDIDDADTLTFSFDAPVAGLSLMNATTGAWSFDPADAAYDSLADGEQLTITANYSVTDGNGGVSTSTLTLTVTGTNDAAAAIGGAIAGTAVEDVAGTISGQLTVTDVDNPDNAFQVASGTGASGFGTYTVGADGLWTYDLNSASVQNLGATTSTTDTFTVTSQDGTQTETVTITINGVNDAAVIGGASTGTVVEDAVPNTVGGTLTHTDVDDDNADSVFTASAGTATYGDYTFAADGDWVYTLGNANAAVNALNAGDNLVDTFTVASEDGTTQVVSVTIDGANDAAAAIGGAIAGTAVEDVAGTISGQLTVTDVDNPDNTFQVASGTGASGFGTYTVGADGLWTYDLNSASVQNLGATTSTTDTFTVTSQDGTQTETVTITINGVNDAAVIGGASTGTVVEDAVPNTVGGTLTHTDVDDDNADNAFTASGAATTYGSYTIDAAGAWVYTLDNANAAVNALNAGDNLVDTFTVASEDGTTQVVSVTIDGANDAAAAIGGAIAGTAVEDVAGTISGQLTVTDVDNPDNAFQVASGTGASGFGTYTVGADGLWTYDLNSASVQNLGATTSTTDTFTVTSQDGTQTETVTITINGVNDAAVIGGASTGTVVEDAVPNTVGGTLTHTDVDDDNADNAFTASGAATTYGSYTIDAAGAWVYTLDNANAAVNALNAGDNLVDTFTVASEDGTTQVVSVTIDGANDAAAAIGGAIAGTAVEDVAGTISGQLTVTDVDNPDNAFQVASGTGASGFGTYTVGADGLWTYDLNSASVQNLGATTSTTDTFTVTSQDGTQTETVTITINGVNDAAVIGGASTGTVVEDAAPNTVGGTLTHTDVDDDNADNAFTASGAATTYGSYTIDAAGAWVYTLDNGNTAVQGLGISQSLSDSFVVAAQDGTQQTVSVTINGANDAPTVVAETAQTVEGGAVFGGSMSANDSDIDGDSLTYTIKEITLQTNTGATMGTPQTVTPLGATDEEKAESYASQTGVSITPEGFYTFDPTIAQYQDLNATQERIMTLTYTVDDGNATTDGTLTVTVQGGNTPVASAVVTSFDNNGFSVEATDPDLNETLALVLPTATTPVVEQTTLNNLLNDQGGGTHTGTFDVSTNGANPFELIDIVVTDGPTSADSNHTLLVGSDAADTAASEASRTFIAYGFAGNDDITGGDLDDLIVGGAGIDSLKGGLGNDRLFGDTDDLLIDGGQDDDTLVVVEAGVDPDFDDQGGDGQLVAVENIEFFENNLVVNVDQQTEDFTVNAYVGATSVSTLVTGSGSYIVVTTAATDQVNIDANEIDGPSTLTLVGPGSFTVTNLHADLDASAQLSLAPPAMPSIGTLDISTIDEGVANTFSITTGEAATTVNSPAGVSNSTININSTLLPDDEDLTLTGDSDFNVTALQGDLVGGTATGDINVTAVTGDVDQTLTTGSGADTINAGDGIDTIVAGAGADSITAGDGADVITGGAGDDTINAGAGDDTINDFVEADILDGGTGYDQLVLTATSASLNDGVVTSNADLSNVETVTAASAAAAVTIDLSAQTEGFEGKDSFATDGLFDGIIGSANGDTITGSQGVDEISSGDGDDTIINFVGADKVDGGTHTTADRILLDGGTSTDLNTAADADIVNVETISGENAGEGVTIGLSNQTEGFVGDAAVQFDGIIGSDHADTITGTGDIDEIDGGASNDAIDGGMGADKIRGGDGIDTITGGAGADEMEGNLGADIFIIDADDDHEVVGETIDGGAGVGVNDIIRFTDITSTDTLTLNATVVEIESVNIETAAGVFTATNAAGVDVSNVTGDIDVKGNDGNNTLTGNASQNVIDGRDGNDVIDGKGGRDTLNGGDGDDTFIIADNADHTPSEIINGGGQTTADEILYTEVGAETLVLTSGVTDVEQIKIADADGLQTATHNSGIDASSAVGVFTLSGNAGDNSLLGNASNGTIDGNAGDDTITGGAGNDMLNGGAGDDVFVDFDGADIVDGGSDYDQLSLSATSATLNDGVTTSDADLVNVETVTAAAAAAAVTLDLSAQTEGFVGQAAISFDGIIGSGNDDTITGSSGIDEIGAGAGNDTIIGFSGADKVDGGAHTTADRILLDGGTSTDLNSAADADIVNIETVSAENALAGVTIDLSLQTEGFTGAPGTAGIPPFDGIIGSAFADTLTGTAARDQIGGGDGNDSIAGGDGNDDINGDGGNDTITGGAGFDELRGGQGDDRFIIANESHHEGGAERIRGGAGTDDKIIFTQEADAIVLTLANQVSAIVNGVEEIVIDDAAFSGASTHNSGIDASSIRVDGDVALTGNAGDNFLAGNDFDNTITGGDGNDTITGGADNNGATNADTLLGNGGDDIFIISNSTHHGLGEIITGGDGGDEIHYTTTTSNQTLTLRAGVTEVETARVVNAGVTANANINATAVTEAINLVGDEGSNTLTGNASVNEITGGAGADSISAGAGNDTIHDFIGADVVDGGTDTDQLKLSATSADLNSAGNGSLVNVETVTATGAVAAVTIDLSNQTEGFIGAAAGGFDGIVGSDNNDTITGSSGDDEIGAGDGDDTIINFSGADKIDGGNHTATTGADRILLNNGDSTDLDAAADADVVNVETISAENVGGPGGISIDLSNQTEGFRGADDTNFDGIIGSAQDDTIVATSGVDQIDGGNGNDTITGAAGADQMLGGAGDDIFIIENAADHPSVAPVEVITGGELGETTGDEIHYTTATAGETLTLSSGVTEIETARVVNGGATANANIVATDVTDAINLVGDNGNNTLTGNASVNEITGGDGVDTINAAAGDDIIHDFVGSDSVDGGADYDQLRLTASSTDLDGAGDAEIVNVETVTAATAAAAVTIDLSAQTEGFAGAGGVDFDGIIGSTDNDTITGAQGADEIFAGDGNDVIIGFAGADKVDGGSNIFTADEIRLTATSTDLNAALDADIVNIEQVSAEGAAGNVTIDLSNQTEGFLGDFIGSGLTSGIVGSANNDSITGSTGNDSIFGDGGNDTINEFIGADIVDGGGQDGGAADGDTLNLTEASAAPSPSNDLTTLNAASDAALTNIEQVTMASATRGLTLDLSAQTEGFTGTTGTDHDGIIGSGFNDRIVASQAASEIDAGAGDDVVVVDDANDDVEGGAGTDTLEVDNADYVQTDTALLTNVESVALLSDTGDTHTVDLSAFTTVFTLNGGDGNDTLIGSESGAPTGDTIDGGSGDDTIRGGAGADVITGGTGADTFVYDGDGDSTGQGGSQDTVNDFVSGADKFLVTIDDDFSILQFNGLNFLSVPAGGSTTLGDGAGDGYYDQSAGQLAFDLDNNGAINNTDILINSANDVVADDIIFNVTGDTGADTIFGGTGDDTLIGGGGDDTLGGGQGDDVLNGGAGTDTVNYGILQGTGLGSASYDDSIAVTVNLGGLVGGHHAERTVLGVFEKDELIDVENVIGSKEADDITGDGGANVLNGAQGADILNGGANDGVADTLTGGADADTFELSDQLQANTSAPSQTAVQTDGSTIQTTGANLLDIITDFGTGADSIVLINDAGTDITANLAQVFGTFTEATGNFVVNQPAGALPGQGADILFYDSTTESATATTLDVYGVYVA